MEPRSNAAARHVSSAPPLRPLGTAATPAAASERVRPSTSMPKKKFPQSSFLGPVGVTKCLARGELNEVIARLSRPNSGHRSADAPHKEPPQRPHSALNVAEIQESVDRLYHSSVKHKLETSKKLADMYLFHPPTTQTTLSPSDLCAKVVQRFFTEETERQAKRTKELFEKYIAATEPRMTKKSREELRAIADRLGAKA